MNEITKLAVNFIENHFEQFDLKKCDLENYSKKQTLKECKKEYWFACWVVTELMSWGLEKDYLELYMVEHDGDFLVMKVSDMYFRINFETHCLDEVEVKTKIVSYFE